MHHRGVVAAAELTSDFRIGKGCQGLCQIHRDLPWAGDVAGTAGGKHLCNTNVVMRRHTLLDFVDTDLAAAGPQQVGQKFGGAVDGDFAANKAGMRGDPGQRAFKLTNIARDAVRQKLQHFVRNCDPGTLGLGLQNAEPQFIVGGVNVGHHAPSKP